MADYYTSQFSGEEIDAALRAAQIISGASTLDELRKKLEIRGDTIPVSATDPTPVSEALTASGGGVNPNLLDNWYFGRPVNQRGQTEYTGNNYYIDRWRSWDGDTASLSVVSGGIKIAGTLYQYFESAFFEELWGKTVALSLLLADGTLYTDSFALKRADWYSVHINAHGLNTIQFGINNNDFGNENNNFLKITPATVGTLSDTILAAKLELGSTQTLAHKEGDKWVLNEIPDFGEQLRRCQMYYLGDTQRDGYGKSTSNNEIYVVVPLPATMRAKPVIASSSKWGNLISGDGEITGISSIEVAALMDNLVILRVVTNSTISTNKAFIMTDTRFALSADL